MDHSFVPPASGCIRAENDIRAQRSPERTAMSLRPLARILPEAESKFQATGLQDQPEKEMAAGMETAHVQAQTAAKRNRLGMDSIL